MRCFLLNSKLYLIFNQVVPLFGDGKVRPKAMALLRRKPVRHFFQSLCKFRGFERFYFSQTTDSSAFK